MGTVWASAWAAGSPGPAWASSAAGTTTATEAAIATDLNARPGRDRRLPKLIRPLSGPHRRDATISRRTAGQRSDMLGQARNITKLRSQFIGSQRSNVR